MSMRRVYGTGRQVYRRCTRCGRGGARCYYGGWVHKPCLSPVERKDYEQKLRASYKAPHPSMGQVPANATAEARRSRSHQPDVGAGGGQ